MKKVVCVYGQHSEHSDFLNARAKEYAQRRNMDYEWKPQEPFTQEGVISALKDADAGIIDVEKYDEEIFSRLEKNTKLLVRYGVGFDAVNLKDATNYKIAIARTTAANAQSVAEMALALILAAKRRFPKCDSSIRSGEWSRNIGTELMGKTVGILGFGAIGSRLAKILQGFDPKILIYDPYISEEKARECGVELADLDTVFSQSDVISVHLPYSEQTHRIIDAERFAQMKKEAVLVCTSRGNIVDEKALYHALKNGIIAGAGLDVFATEPLPLDSKLLELDNIVLTPHASAQTMDALWNMYKKAIDICADFFEGKGFAKGDLLNPEVFER